LYRLAARSIPAPGRFFASRLSANSRDFAHEAARRVMNAARILWQDQASRRDSQSGVGG
jgi:hypothetical protein